MVLVRTYPEPQQLARLSTLTRLTCLCRPLEGGVPVGPDQLDRHRYTHYFKGPQCLCAFKNGTTGFNEAKIGLVQAIQPGAANCLGQYVAACATQQCGYFGKILFQNACQHTV